MAYIEHTSVGKPNKKIMIFLEGTIFYTKPILFLFSSKGYVPIGNCIEIINSWYDQGVEIIFCTYARRIQINFIVKTLESYGLKYHKLCYRKLGERYKDLVGVIRPDVLIEDDCKSIGGPKQMCITFVKPEIKTNINSIVIKEYTGIDFLSKSVLDK